MNADRLLGHFEQISDAPDAVDRLRRFILDLAVRGKLVEQDPGESVGPSGVAVSGEPFPLPSNWSCVALGGVLHMINGRAFKPSEWLSTGLPIVRIQNLNNDSAPFNCCDPTSVDAKHVIDNNAFLISWSGTPGTSFGAFIWQRGKAALNQHIFKCLPTGTQFFDRFLQLAINGRLDEMIAKAHGGVGLQHITKGKLEALALPLPPLAEQHRIVGKVDELMRLCDRLEASHKQRESRRDRLVVASLNRLGQPTDPDEFKKDAEFQLSNLNRLSAKPEHVKELQKAILNLAVRGKLVPQDDSEGTGAECLTTLGLRSANAKERVIDNVPFMCPKGWVWTTVQDLLDANREISYGVIKLGDEPKHGGIPTLRCSDVRPGFIAPVGIRRVHESIEANYARTRLTGGEIVINIRGTLGGVACVPDEMCGYNVAREVAVVPIALRVHGPYVKYVMLSPFFWEHITVNLRGIAYKGLNLSILRGLPIPLPPLAGCGPNGFLSL